MASDPALESTGKDTLFGHPRGLFFLFGTEAAERFSYYGMRALLVLYLISYQQFAPAQASTVYKWYTSLVYLTPLLGGFLADRFLGLKKAILIGGVLMGIGHFLMAFEPLPFMYTALAFLILGNGFFKPNISTLVGKLYTHDDKRRDGGFSIFYMGINVGAGLAGPVCGALRKNLGWHYGFAAAGIGMMIGLTIFLLGQKTIARAVDLAGNSMKPGGKKEGSAAEIAEPSDQVPGVGGLPGMISKIYPFILLTLAIVVPAVFVWKALNGQESWLNVIMPAAFALVGGGMGLLLLRLKNATRNKATVVFVFFLMVVLFWMAFEQAGNALNIWAEFNTRRQMGPVETTAEGFQVYNAAFIVILAPVFGFLWVFFEKKGMGIPTPIKVTAGLVFLTLGFVAMTAAAKSEDSTLFRVKLAALPPQVKVQKASGEQQGALKGELFIIGTQSPSEDPAAHFEPVHAGRMLFDPAAGELLVRGVLPPFARMDALKPTVDDTYLASLNQLEKSVKYASEKPATVLVGPVSPDYRLPRLEQVTLSMQVRLKVTPPTGGATLKLEEVPEGTPGAVYGLQLTFNDSLSPVDKAALVGAGAPPQWRAALDELAKDSNAARVTGWWLVLCYLFSTLAELCISPIGLSLVTKLAPVRFASLFMGAWFLTNSVAQYVGGALGELWGRVPPTNYFFLFIITSAIGAFVLLPLIVPIKKLMHEVK